MLYIVGVASALTRSHRTAGDYVPGPAKDVKVTQTRGANASVDAVVSWTPPSELTCLYEVVLWSPSMLRVQQKELHVVSASLVLGLRFSA